MKSVRGKAKARSFRLKRNAEEDWFRLYDELPVAGFFRNAVEYRSPLPTVEFKRIFPSETETSNAQSIPGK